MIDGMYTASEVSEKIGKPLNVITGITAYHNVGKVFKIGERYKKLYTEQDVLYIASIPTRRGLHKTPEEKEQSQALYVRSNKFLDVICISDGFTYLSYSDVENAAINEEIDIRYLKKIRKEYSKTGKPVFDDEYGIIYWEGDMPTEVLRVITSNTAWRLKNKATRKPGEPLLEKYSALQAK